MKQIKKFMFIFLALAGFALLVAGCQAEPVIETVEVEVTRVVVQTQVVEKEKIVEVIITPEPGPDMPFFEAWMTSGHADAAAPAFRYWDGSGEVPTSCAKCHTADGYLDFLGLDGSEAGKVDAAHAPAAMGVTCVACHNSVTAVKDSVVFPSGIELTGLGDASRCMECHQGRASTVSVNAAIERFGGVEAPDAVPAAITNADGSTSSLGFINIHYYPAGATLYGTQAKGGYEYDGKMYDIQFRHVEGFDTCISCHNPHTLEVEVESCAHCHEGVTSVEDLKAIRMFGSLADYDGDGDVAEGIAAELETMQEALYVLIRAYASEVAGTGIVYDSSSYPYFFQDADGDGAADTNAEGRKVGYPAWTPRLLRAAYNYQLSVKDPGAFAHNAKYLVQLMYDSMEDLNSAVAAPIDMSAMHRIDPGHFAGSTMPFRDWDADGEVPGRCAKCHSATGLPQFIKEGVNVAAPLSNGFMCTTCHNSEEWPSLYTVNSVTFPSGKVVSFAQDADGKNVADSSNTCLLCHQGRSSTVTVNQALGSKDPGTIDASIRFSNIHYFAAGATIFGGDVQGAYQFAGKEYVGQSPHPVVKCAECHNVHALEIEVDECADCHRTETNPQDIYSYRGADENDYDGDGDVAEGIKAELDSLSALLYDAMRAYATEKGTGILYDSHAYPYFFLDVDGDGVADLNDSGRAISFNAFTPDLLKAAYNYQYYQKDPGAFTHNAKYVAQVLYDSIEAMGGDVTTLTRP